MLKKFLIGTFVVAVLFMGVFTLVTTKANAEAQAIVTVADVQYAATVRLGSSGQASLIWQRFFNGYSTTAQLVEDGAFGPLTNVQAKAWQASRGLVADGVLGPLSRASAMAQIASGTPASAFPAGCTSTVGYSSVTGLTCAPVALPAGCTAGSLFSATTGLSCTVANTTVAGCAVGAAFSSTTGASCTGTGTPVVTGPLVGSFGTISTFTQLSQYSNEEVGSGSTGIKVAGFEVKPASGDIELTAMKLMFDDTGYTTGDSTRIIDYLTKVYVYMGSTLVGSASTADFSKDSTGIYSLTLPLNGAVVRKDIATSFYVSADAVSNLDSEDINSDSWTLGIANVRYVDGSGVTTTDTSSMPVGLIYSTGGIAGTDGVGISFVTFATAAGTELKISADATNPVASVIKVSTTIDTPNVVLLKGKMKLEGTSDVWLDELPIVLTSTGSSIDALASSVKLTIDGKEFTESLGANCVQDSSDWTTSESCASASYKTSGVIFDNLDVTIKAGTTIYFTVSATINDIESSTDVAVSFNEGESLLATLTTTTTTGARAHIVAENAQGDQLTDATEMTGSVTGVAQVFRSSGISVALVSTSTAVTLGDGTTATTISDSGTFTITFDVTANGSDISIDSSNPTATSSLTATDLDVVGAGTLAATIQNISGGSAVPEAPGTGFIVRDGTSQRFVVTAHILATTSGYFNVAIGTGGIGYALTDVDGTLAYTTGLTSFKTANLYLNDY